MVSSIAANPALADANAAEGCRSGVPCAPPWSSRSDAHLQNACMTVLYHPIQTQSLRCKLPVQMLLRDVIWECRAPLHGPPRVLVLDTCRMHAHLAAVPVLGQLQGPGLLSVLKASGSIGDMEQKLSLPYCAGVQKSSAIRCRWLEPVSQQLIQMQALCGELPGQRSRFIMNCGSTYTMSKFPSFWHTNSPPSQPGSL